MATITVNGTGSFDFDWDLPQFQGPPIFSDATQLLYADPEDPSDIVILIGTFSAFDGNGRPTVGTITEIHGGDPSEGVDIIGLSLSVAQFFAYVDARDPRGLQAVLFGAADTMTGSGLDDQFLGFAGNDTLSGGGGNDLIIGGADDDTLNGETGNDTLYAGSGDDTVQGGDGDDVIYGGSGTDTLYGGDGNDLIGAGSGLAAIIGPGPQWAIGNYATVPAADVIDGGAGTRDGLVISFAGSDDSFTVDISDPNVVAPILRNGAAFGSVTGIEVLPFAIGGRGNDTFIGGNDSDSITGGDGADVLIGNGATDFLTGDGGDDTITGGAGDDVITGGTGVDTAVFSGNYTDYSFTAISGTAQGQSGLPVIVVKDNRGIDSTTGVGAGDHLYGIEYLQFADGTQLALSTVIGNANANQVGSSSGETLSGLTSVGVDFIDGGAGDDTLNGGDGIDWLNGGADNDTINGGNGNDQISGGAGIDQIDGGAGNDLIDGGAGDDVIVTGGGADTINGDGGNDQITGSGNFNGGAGNDTLTAVADGLADNFEGADGDDTFNGVGFETTVLYVNATNGVTVNLGTLGPQFTSATTGWDTISNVWSVTGSNYDDVLTGDGNDNFLTGRSGDDQLFGLGANDTFLPGFGDDLVDGGSGIDTVNYSDLGQSVVVDLSIVGSQYIGLGGMETYISIENVTGSGLDDQLKGDASANILNGVNGNDTLMGRGGNDRLSGGNGFDFASYEFDTGAVTVTLATPNVAQNTIGSGTDTLVGIEGLIGSAFGDTLTGDGNGNAINGMGGNDTLDGGNGSDNAIFNGRRADYSVVLNGNGSLTVTDLRPGSPDGTDILTNFENLQFWNITQTVAEALTPHAAVITGDISGSVAEAADLSTVTTATGALSATDIDNATDFSVFQQGVYGTLSISAAGAWTYTLNNANATVDALNTGAQLADSVIVQTADGTQQSIAITINGADDIRIGTAAGETLTGTGGNDTLQGLGGTDILNGGDGNDILEGGAGADALNGGNGIDTVSYANATSGVYFSIAVPNDPANSGDAAGDTFSSIENMLGSNFNDVLIGSGGVNLIQGGQGDDYLIPILGNDTLDGGSGFDVVYHYILGGGFTSGVNLTLLNQGVAQNTGRGFETFFSIEGLVGSQFADTLIGDGNANLLAGGAGVDIIQGGGGDDLITVGNAGSTVDGGAGIDLLGFVQQLGVNFVQPVGGVHVSLALQGASAQNTTQGMLTLNNVEHLSGTTFADELTGDGGNNSLGGDDGDDMLSGGGGDDRLYGDGRFVSTAFVDFGSGADTLTGGAGNDTLFGGAGSDIAVYSGVRADYSVVQNLDGSLTVTDLRGGSPDGTDTLRDVETLRFSNGDVTATENRAPTANAGSASGAEDSVAIAGQATATDLDGNALSYVLVGDVAHGQLTFNADGSFSYTPDANYNGSDSFTFKANDGLVDSVTATVTLTIDPVNDAPVAGGSSPTVNEDTLLNGAVSASDIDGDSLTYSLVADVSHGQLTFNADGSYSYTPAANYNGPDSFTFKANDGLVDSNTATVTMTVNAVSDASVVGGVVTGAVAESSVLNGVSQTTGQLTVSDPDGPASFVAAPLPGLYGTLTLTALGGWTYVLNNGNAAVDGLSAGESLIDTIQVTTSDGTTANVAVTINGANDVRTGTGAGDNLTGTSGIDTISGLGGNDLIDGGAGADFLDGGANGGTGDTVTYASAGSGVVVSLALATAQGGAGGDTLTGFENLTGSLYDDVLAGDGGGNTLSGLAGNDTLDGGVGSVADILDGGADNDTASFLSSTSGVNASLLTNSSTGAGNDTFISIENLTGSNLVDVLTGDGGANVLNGADGDDSLEGGGGNDILIGGTNTAVGDTAVYTTAGSRVDVSLLTGTASGTSTGVDTLSEIENVTGSNFDDGLTGDANANRLTGRGGNDTLEGGGGNDILDGGAGTGDTVTYLNAASGVTVNLTTNTASGVSTGADTLIAVENITGSGFVDSLTGNTAVNRIDGGAGDDTIDGGAGNAIDTLIGGGGINTLSYFSATGAVNINLSTGVASGASGADVFSGFQNLNGSIYDDILTGDGGVNTIFGDAGDDTIDGGLGADFLSGGANTAAGDTVSYASAGVGVTVSLAIATPQNGAGGDTLSGFENLTGSNFNDVLTGTAGNNVLSGGLLNDRLTGAAGADSLYGGAGADTFVFTALGDSTVAAAGRDKIFDFSHAEGDKIDLSAIDAITGGPNNAFTLVAAFTGVAGQLIAPKQGGSTYIVQGDVNGDGVADFAITVVASAPLVASDFLL